MYFQAGNYIGEYSNNDNIAPVTGSDDTGLNTFSRAFFVGPIGWARSGLFEVAFKFDVDDFIDDIFYFCQVHTFMTGRIKFVNSEGAALNEVDFPTIDYEYHEPSAYDQSCGTYALSDFQLPHPECPEKFVCNKPGGKVGKFGECLDSMNCAMAVGMTTNVNKESASALFMHQMIPHHQNAVNMCKALFKTGEIDCDDVTQAQTDVGCGLAVLCYEIINAQNYQIDLMRTFLTIAGYDQEDDCKVNMSEPLDYHPKSPKAPKSPKKAHKKHKSPKGRV